MHSLSLATKSTRLQEKTKHTEYISCYWYTLRKMFFCCIVKVPRLVYRSWTIPCPFRVLIQVMTGILGTSPGRSTVFTSLRARRRASHFPRLCMLVSVGSLTQMTRYNVAEFNRYPVISFHGQIVPSQIVPISSQIVPQNSQFVPQKSQFVPHTLYLFSKCVNVIRVQSGFFIRLFWSDFFVERTDYFVHHQANEFTMCLGCRWISSSSFMCFNLLLTFFSFPVPSFSTRK